ncbi:DUF2097 family protein [Methanocaldococcus indicus]|uniref:DUF2097 family protein n=1 Tax=Methanocaldococcus indicus TaxID=213231 RepID=UPI003C6D4B19
MTTTTTNEFNKKNIKEIFEYIIDEIDEGEYVEIYFGRVHIEGEFFEFDEEDGIIKIATEKYGIVEIDLNKIDEIILEFVHYKNNIRNIFKFY